MTECKSWKTAIRRFFKSLTDYPEFNGWQDGILESCENGYFSDKETYFEGGKSVYCKGGYFWEVEIMMIADTSALMFPSNENPPRRLRR